MLTSPKPTGIDADPQTLGEHVKCMRLRRGLTQQAVGALLGVSAGTVLNWEKGETEPPIASMPAIIQFLGYDPFPKPESLTERMHALRRTMGWTIKEAAEHLHVDPSAWGTWERTGHIPWKRYRDMVEAFVSAHLPSRETVQK